MLTVSSFPAKRAATITMALAFVVLGCSTNVAGPTPEQEVTTLEEAKMRLSSAAFQEGGAIPLEHTCDGSDTSPPLSWGPVPEGTRSIALVSDDPDAPGGTWVHWVAYAILPDATGLPAGLPATETLPTGARHGKNDFGRIGYGGPCPPSGTHRYFFKLYALDTEVDLAPGATKQELLRAMSGHTLAVGRLMGTYGRRVSRR